MEENVEESLESQEGSFEYEESSFTDLKPHVVELHNTMKFEHVGDRASVAEESVDPLLQDDIEMVVVKMESESGGDGAALENLISLSTMDHVSSNDSQVHELPNSPATCTSSTRLFPPNKQRAQKCTQGQMKVLVEYMCNHKEFAVGNFHGSVGKKLHKIMWQSLSEQLNSVGGPKKDVTKWQECWKNMKTQTKKKHSLINRTLHSGSTAEPTPVLTTNEEKVMSLLLTVPKSSGTAIGSPGVVQVVTQDQIQTRAPAPSTSYASDTTVVLQPVNAIIFEPRPSAATDRNVSSSTELQMEIIPEQKAAQLSSPQTVDRAVKRSHALVRDSSPEVKIVEILPPEAGERAPKRSSSPNSPVPPRRKRNRVSIAERQSQTYRSALLKSQINTEAMLTKLTENTNVMATALTKLSESSDSTATSLAEISSSLKELIEAMVSSLAPPPPVPSPPLPPPPSP